MLTAQTRLARLPLLESISTVERACFPPGLIASLAMRTLLVNPVTRRAGLGLRDIIVSADSLGSEETLVSLVGACPNLCRCAGGPSAVLIRQAARRRRCIVNTMASPARQLAAGLSANVARSSRRTPAR